MTFITKLNKKSVLIKIIKFVLVTAFWLLVWEAASRYVSRNNDLLLLILPGPSAVFKKWAEIAFTDEYLMATLHTLLRIFFGFMIGTISAIVLGIFTHLSSIINALFSPMLKLIRAVPVVAVIILLYLFLDSNILPVVIVVLMVLPVVWQTVHDGLDNTDQKLMEMAKVYNISLPKIFFSIKLPLIVPSLISSIVNSLGLAWKSGVAAEVICLPEIALGGMLWSAKGSIEFETVYAITLTVVILSIIIEILLKYIVKKLLKGRI